MTPPIVRAFRVKLIGFCTASLTVVAQDERTAEVEAQRQMRDAWSAVPPDDPIVWAVERVEPLP